MRHDIYDAVRGFTGFLVDINHAEERPIVEKKKTEKEIQFIES